MASYLIWLKSRILLPVDILNADGEERNPVEELKEMLMAYRAIKRASHGSSRKDPCCSRTGSPRVPPSRSVASPRRPWARSSRPSIRSGRGQSRS
ncbi:MAG: hypothetical protein MZU79_09210 [Anaerotruncus sp.]|nr:hypothetical protein [Anaerotruncus sp.]